MLLKLLRPFCLKFVPLFLSLPVSQLCLMLCDPMDCSPPGSSVLGILQARTLEWGAISFSNAWKWKVKVKSLSRVWLFATPWTAAYRLLRPWEFPGKSTGVWCLCLLQFKHHYVFRKRTGKGSRLKLLNISKLIHQSNNWLQLFYLYKERVGKFHGYFPSGSNTPSLCGLFFQDQVVYFFKVKFNVLLIVTVS